MAAFLYNRLLVCCSGTKSGCRKQINVFYVYPTAQKTTATGSKPVVPFFLSALVSHLGLQPFLINRIGHKV
jgi:hypothetical protein